MVYNTTSYLSTTFEEFSECEYLEYWDESEPDLHPLWQLYNTLADEAAELVESGDFFRQLCQILDTLPSLQEVCLTNKTYLRGECECHQAALDAATASGNPFPMWQLFLKRGRCPMMRQDVFLVATV